MFRSSPPSGRAYRLLTIATLLCSVVIGVPAAGAQVPTEAPSELPQASIAAAVTGLESLRVNVAGDDLALTVTDAAGNVATYELDPATASDNEYAVDLNTPDDGAAPANGTATVVLTAGDATLLSAEVLLDRDPATPAMGATASPRAATLVWSAVAGPGTVTYRLERATHNASWATLADGLTGTSYRDAGLEPGHYRYRLTAAAPAAGEGVNRSQPALADVRIAALPDPPPSPGPPSPPVPADPFPRSPAELPELATPVPTRAVAVAGEIRRGITERGPRRTPRPQIAFANRPGMTTPFRAPLTPFAPVTAEEPEAAVAAEGDPESTGGPLQVPIAPSSMLAVQAGTPLDGLQLGDVGALLAVGLLAAMSGLARRRRHAAYSGGGRSPVNT